MTLASGLPQGRNQPQPDDLNTEEIAEPVPELRQIIHCQTKEVIYVNEASIDAAVSRFNIYFYQIFIILSYCVNTNNDVFI